jgi:hypothetical protein
MIYEEWKAKHQAKEDLDLLHEDKNILKFRN